MGTRPVSETLKLRTASGRNSMDKQSFHDTEDMLTEVDVSQSADERIASGRPPRPEELGNTRGKRLAMKFVNKIANKEKYTQVCSLATDQQIWTDLRPDSCIRETL